VSANSKEQRPSSGANSYCVVTIVGVSFHNTNIVVGYLRTLSVATVCQVEWKNGNSKAVPVLN
jgi:hypothetical protein